MLPSLSNLDLAPQPADVATIVTRSQTKRANATPQRSQNSHFRYEDLPADLQTLVWQKLLVVKGDATESMCRAVVNWCSKNRKGCTKGEWKQACAALGVTPKTIEHVRPRLDTWKDWFMAACVELARLPSPRRRVWMEAVRDGWTRFRVRVIKIDTDKRRHPESDRPRLYNPLLPVYPLLREIVQVHDDELEDEDAGPNWETLTGKAIQRNTRELYEAIHANAPIGTIKAIIQKGISYLYVTNPDSRRSKGPNIFYEALRAERVDILKALVETNGIPGNLYQGEIYSPYIHYGDFYPDGDLEWRSVWMLTARRAKNPAVLEFLKLLWDPERDDDAYRYY
jgi:hypothetical protein